VPKAQVNLPSFGELTAKDNAPRPVAWGWSV